MTDFAPLSDPITGRAPKPSRATLWGAGILALIAVYPFVLSALVDPVHEWGFILFTTWAAPLSIALALHWCARRADHAYLPIKGWQLRSVLYAVGALVAGIVLAIVALLTIALASS